MLTEQIGAPILSSNTTGSFNRSGILLAGHSYQLHVVTTLSLRTSALFDKSNDWTIDFIMSEVPEPATSFLAMCLFAPLFLSRCRTSKTQVLYGR